MAASKKKASSKGKGKTAGKKKTSGGFVAFLKSQRFAHIRGAIYILFAAFLLIAMVGYYATDGGATGRWLGSAGHAVAELFAINLFGIGSLGFVLLFFVYGMRLWGSPVMPWWQTFGATLFWMVWCSLTLGYIGGAWVKDPDFERFAGIGLQMAATLHQWLRWWTLVLLVFVAVLFMVLVHNMQLPEVHLPKVDVKKAVKAVEDELMQAATDHSDEGVSKAKPVAAPATVITDDTATAADEDDPGADFDDEAMRLFHSTPEDLDATATEPRQATPAEEPEFDIDKAFELVNARAQGKEPPATDDGINFTIVNENDTLNESDNDQDGIAEQTDDTPDADDELEPDDYRRHIGLDEPYDPHLDLKNYIMPGTDILEDWEVANTKVTKEELIANKDRIVQTLRDYGIEITDISAIPGPTVTLYKIKPAAGVRISKIKNLEDDIALSLAALGIRIIAPIPGESNVGIEVPNAKPQIVAMKTMLESEAFQAAKAKMELPIAFGKTISNECFVTDLAKMPHLLMAGATGTGKSVGLNAVLASLLYTKHPSELKLVLVDPKKVEFSLYSALERHYLAKMPDEEEGVITDVKKVVRTLNSLCIEMDSRYDLLKQAKVRKITEYNEKFCKRALNPENGHRYLPYIVVVIDEFGDLIMTAGKEVELPIARLAQLARAVGIHLIIATQRPTTNIITGTIKANFPARVAFRVTSGIDSKTILDTGGAQQLIGRGDMLISLAGKDMIRLQCALIDTPEIEKLVRYIGDQRGYADGFTLPEYLDENEEPNKEFDAKSKDEYFNDAARLVVSSQFGSTSLLQRKLQLGYNRAGRIIDQLEAAGIVGPSNGSKPRDVLIHDEVSLEELLKSL